MSQGSVAAATALISLGCLTTGAAVFGRGEPQAPPVAVSKEDPKPKAEKPSIADQYQQIVKAFEAEQKKLSEAVEKYRPRPRP